MDWVPFDGRGLTGDPGILEFYRLKKGVEANVNNPKFKLTKRQLCH